MFNFLILILLISTPSFAIDNIKNELYHLVSDPHKPITYKEANINMFTIIDNHKGVVCSVYSPSVCITTDIVPSAKVMNVEHTWPQSEGANGFAKSDLHHLFPTTSSTNSMRSSLPFCNVVVVKWEADQSKRGLGSFGEHCFEPPTAHKGNIARALFYFSIRYNIPIDPHQEAYLKQWHQEDPVNQDDIERNKLINKFQNNTNPFIDNPELVDRISDF